MFDTSRTRILIELLGIASLLCRYNYSYPLRLFVLVPLFSPSPLTPRHCSLFLQYFFENITTFLDIIPFFKSRRGSDSRTSGRTQATPIGIFIVELTISSLSILGLLGVISLVLLKNNWTLCISLASSLYPAKLEPDPQSTAARPGTAQTQRLALLLGLSPSSLLSDLSASLTLASCRSTLSRSRLSLGTTPAAKGSATPRNVSAMYAAAAAVYGLISTPDPLAPTALQKHDVPTATGPSQPDTITAPRRHGVRMVGLLNLPKRSSIRSDANVIRSSRLRSHPKP